MARATDFITYEMKTPFLRRRERLAELCIPQPRPLSAHQQLAIRFNRHISAHLHPQIQSKRTSSPGSLSLTLNAAYFHDLDGRPKHLPWRMYMYGYIEQASKQATPYVLYPLSRSAVMQVTRLGERERKGPRLLRWSRHSLLLPCPKVPFITELGEGGEKRHVEIKEKGCFSFFLSFFLFIFAPYKISCVLTHQQEQRCGNIGT